ncbi:M28 family peptidase [Roseimaritima ulvae]|uniref:M28 family peptidase n=1 Tax=Roseimaritima ulvae TaxID=980254 RepID=UPI00192E6D5F|nr:M28 family peptidase [Roseimaritima ulvae]
MLKFFVCCFVAVSATVALAQSPDAGVELSVASIDEAVVRGHIRFLADDLLEGRGPGSRGDALTQLYLATQFQSMGLQPAGVEGGWTQPFPLIGVQTHCPPSITFRGQQSVTFQYYDDYIATTGRPQAQVEVTDAPLVFVGYGIQAPEYDWDDYKDVDVRGKILIMMNNDPADDPQLFEGKRRLYYGRWDYKYAMAAKMGAAGAFIIHTEASAGYPYQVVQTSWSGEESELADEGQPRTNVRGWLTEDAAKKLMSSVNLDLDDLRAQAQKSSFRPVELPTKLSVELTAEVRENNTANVLAMLEGSDPEREDEYVIFMAHHDHIGIASQRSEDGDNIYNGAIDNASGTAALLAIARACTQLPQRPRRSILFVAVGAEEQGLLGSKFFAANPTVPPGKMAAVVNIDGVNRIGRTHDVNMIGMGKSSLDEIVKQVAQLQNRIVTPDHFPDRGYYYRSDQFSLAKIGVPGIYLHSGVNVIGKPEGWGKQQLDRWVKEDYHQPSDEYAEDWDLSGAIEDIRLLYRAGLRIADDDAMPSWNPGDEFEAARKQAIAETQPGS